MTNFVPFSSNTSSSFPGSSRASPREGPPQPIDIVIRTTASCFCSFKYFFISSSALGVTSNIFTPFVSGFINQFFIIRPYRTSTGYLSLFDSGGVFPFSLSSTGQACLIQVEMPIFGKSHACKKYHTPMIMTNTKKSFIFIYLLSFYFCLNDNLFCFSLESVIKNHRITVEKIHHLIFNFIDLNQCRRFFCIWKFSVK